MPKLGKKEKVIPVSVAGDPYFVRVLSLTQFRHFQEAVKECGEGDSDAWTVQAIIACVCDEAGKPLFSQDDRAEIAEAGVAALLLAEAAIKANGLDVEQAKKN